MTVAIQSENVYKMYRRGRLGFGRITTSLMNTMSRNRKVSDLRLNQEFFALKDISFSINNGE